MSLQAVVLVSLSLCWTVVTPAPTRCCMSHQFGAYISEPRVINMGRYVRIFVLFIQSVCRFRNGLLENACIVCLDLDRGSRKKDGLDSRAKLLLLQLLREEPSLFFYSLNDRIQDAFFLSNLLDDWAWWVLWSAYHVEHTGFWWIVWPFQSHHLLLDVLSVRYIYDSCGNSHLRARCSQVLALSLRPTNSSM